MNKIGALKSYPVYRERRKTPTCSGQDTCSEKIWEKTVSFYPSLSFGSQGPIRVVNGLNVERVPGRKAKLQRSGM